MKRFPKFVPLTPKGRCFMSLSLRTTLLAAGRILAIGTSSSRAQEPLIYYYPAPGNYATTQGTVSIPAAGYYYNVPLYAVPASASPARTQGFTYSNSSFYYPRAGTSMERSVGGANFFRSGPTRMSAYISGDGQDSPEW
jgi:hypothetical protein